MLIAFFYILSTCFRYESLAKFFALKSPNNSYFLPKAPKIGLIGLSFTSHGINVYFVKKCSMCYRLCHTIAYDFHSDYEYVDEKQRTLHEAQLTKQLELNKTTVKSLNHETLLDKLQVEFQGRCLVSQPNDPISHPCISRGVVPLIKREGHESLNRATMEPRAFGSGSLTVEHRSGGDVDLNNERVKLTDSFDSLMEKNEWL